MWRPTVKDLVERYSTAHLLPPSAGARVLRPALRTIGLHWHDYYELSLVLSGTALHVVNGASFVVGPGSAFLMSPADLHSLEALGDQPLDCFNTVIDPALVEDLLRDVHRGSAPGFPWQTGDFADAAPDLRRLQRETDTAAWGSAEVRRSLVTCLVVELARRTGADGVATPAPGDEQPLREATLFVDRHFREPLTLADAAAKAHLSPNYFSERFRQLTGVSFQRYLQERRLRFARSLLMSTALSVTEVCHAAGFNSLSHFGRAYRREYGVPPSSDNVSVTSRM